MFCWTLSQTSVCWKQWINISQWVKSWKLLLLYVLLPFYHRSLCISEFTGCHPLRWQVWTVLILLMLKLPIHFLCEQHPVRLFFIVYNIIYLFDCKWLEVCNLILIHCCWLQCWDPCLNDARWPDPAPIHSGHHPPHLPSGPGQPCRRRRHRLGPPRVHHAATNGPCESVFLLSWTVWFSWSELRDLTL